MEAIKIILITALILTASSGAPKLSSHNYPAWFNYAIQPLIEKNPDETLNLFENALEGKSKKSSKTSKKESGDKKSSNSQKNKEVKNAILLQMEAGRIASITDKLDASQDYFGSCIEKFKQSEMGAVISVSKSTQKTASIIAGESINDYEVKSYEKIMVYIQQAMNYFLKNNLDEAMVEVRNANEEQKRAREKHEKELAEVQKEGKEKNVDYDNIINTNYAGLDEIAGKIKNSFQNAFSFYMAGIISECYYFHGKGSGMDLNDAYISYKDTLEICPENIYVQKDTIRLAKLLGMAEEYKELSQRFPEVAKELETANTNPDKGQLIIIYEYDFVPQMEQIDIPIPTPNGVLSISLPTYPSNSKKEEQNISVSIDNTVSGNTETLCNLGSMAAKNLKEKLPGMLVREVVRTIAMGVAQDQASKRAGVLGSLAVTLIDKKISECDLRAYYSLPYYVSCYRAMIETGKHTVSCSTPSLGNSLSIEIDIQPKTITFIRITEVKGVPYYKVISI